jgi:6-phosphogluconolactonase (cycloisomerase 2 family)
MKSRRRFFLQLAALPAVTVAAPALARGKNANLREGTVFTSSNAVAGNELLAFAPTDDDADLELVAHLPTGGQGTGAGLGSQGAVTLSEDGRFVFVVNAASNTISTFEFHRGRHLRLASTVDSGGLTPISVAESDGLVYVLNAGGSGNVAGFRNGNGELKPLAGGARGLSMATGTGPAQVGFSSDGDVLVVTEKTTSRIASWPVGKKGTLGPIVVTPSSGPTPFGFAFDRRNHLIVSEAPLSTTSSYGFDRRDSATPMLISASVPNGQGAACWVAITPNSRFAYTANATTSNVSSYRIKRSGEIQLLLSAAGSTGNGAGALDLAIPPGGRRLYALAPNSQQIVAFYIEHDGALTFFGAGKGLPVGSAGLAAN